MYKIFRGVKEENNAFSGYLLVKTEDKCYDDPFDVFTENVRTEIQLASHDLLNMFIDEYVRRNSAGVADSDESAS